MIHYNTRNISALKMYYLFKDMGIQNCDFFLELHDEKLQYVDPRDNNLDKETKIRIMREISTNIWYFLREICLIPEVGNIPFEFHRGNIALVWAILHNLSVYVILPRQSYKTYTMAAIYYWLTYWGTSKSTAIFFGHSDSLVINNLDRVKKIRDELPEYLRIHEGKDNSKELHYSILENTIKTKAPGKSKEEAMKVGRGFSTAMQWYDEFPFIDNIKYQYESALYAYTTVSEFAKKNGLPYHRAITTTAASLSTENAIWAYNFLYSCASFSERMYDMDEEAIKKYVSMNSTNNFLRIEYMYYDLSKDDDYLERMIRDSNNNWDAINREVLNMWLDANAEHPLGQDNVILLNNKIIEPKQTLIIDDVYLLKIYRDINEFDFKGIYVAGVDCGGNVSRDFSTFVVVDPTNFEVVATLRTNSYSTTRFSRAIAYIMSAIFPNIVIIPERNAMGITIIDNIIEYDRSLISRIYHDENGKPGLYNNKNTRYQLFNDVLKIAVIEDNDKIHDINIIREISGLITTRSGRIDHRPDSHDDTLMAYLIARWFLTLEKNKIKAKYIPLHIIQSKTSNQNNNEKSEDIFVNNKIKMFMSGKRISNNPFEQIPLDNTTLEMDNSNEMFDTIRKQFTTKSITSNIEVLEGDVNEEELYDKNVHEVEDILSKNSKKIKIDSKLESVDLLSKQIKNIMK